MTKHHFCIQKLMLTVWSWSCKLKKCWIQKRTVSFLGPETDVMDQFLSPETDIVFHYFLSEILCFIIHCSFRNKNSDLYDEANIILRGFMAQNKFILASVRRKVCQFDCIYWWLDSLLEGGNFCGNNISFIIHKNVNIAQSTIFHYKLNLGKTSQYNTV